MRRLSQDVAVIRIKGAMIVVDKMFSRYEHSLRVSRWPAVQPQASNQSRTDTIGRGRW